MPAWILWLSPVIVAPLLAVLWITWAARPKGPEEARETVQRYDRFRAALQDGTPEERHHKAS
jgi:hypothetical protein